jgi:tetratricopeptide (TPR) repeat protein
VQRLSAALAVAVCLAVSLPAAAAPAKELDDARAEFRSGNYALAISLLSTLLYPKSQLSDEREIAEAHLLLGVAYLESGNVKGADNEFEEALFLDLSLTLDPLLFSTRAVDAFDRKKQQIQDRLRAEEAIARAAAQKERLRRFRENAAVVEKRGYLRNFLPFGAGQFQNNHNRKGIGLAVAQALLAGTSAGLYLIQAFRYGFPGDVPVDDVSLVNSLQVAQISTGIAFYGLYVYGVVDALVYFEPEVEVRVDQKLLDEIMSEDDEDKPPPPPPEPADRPRINKPSSLRIFPTPVPQGAGIGIAWEF